MKKNDVNMLSGSITKGLLIIAVPMMVMNILQSLFNIIDMSMLKAYDTGDGFAVGAVGASGSLITLITGLLIGMSAGATVVVARNIGRGDTERVDRAVGSALSLAFVGGIILAVIGLVFAEVFLTWMNCPAQLLPSAVLYFRLYFAGVPISMVYNFSAGILRSSGDSIRPMIYLTIGGALKVLLTYLFVAQFKLGVTGVALATIASWGTSAAFIIVALIKNKGAVKIKFKYLRFYSQEIKEILIIGVPSGLQQGLYSIANVIISSTVNSFGPEATTGISIANNFDGLLYQICIAPSYAVMSYVSQNVGHGNIKRAKQSVGRGMMITLVLGTTFGALSAIFSAELSSLMSSSPVVIQYSQQKMYIISSTYFICGINEILGGALKGMGRPTLAMTTTLIYMCAFRFVWVYLIFPLYRNLTFLYLVWPIGWVLSLITLLFFFFPTLKRLWAKAQEKKMEQTEQTA